MKTVIAGLEEGLNAIAEALEGGGGGGGSIVPTPTLDDDGKVLRVVSQSQEEVAPEWSTVREVPIGGQNGQVLTKGASGYSWANPTGGSYPEPTSATSGQVLTADGLGSASWQTPSGGGGSSVAVASFTVNSSSWSDNGNGTHLAYLSNVTFSYFDVINVYAFYNNSWDNCYPIEIKYFYFDDKTSSLAIVIDDSIYTEISSNSATTRVKIVYAP